MAAKRKGKAGERARTKFKNAHPEGHKRFAKFKRKLGLPRILATREQREFYRKNMPDWQGK